MINIEDHKILALIREGKDREVIVLLYKKVLPQVKNYIVKNNGNKEDAQDIFHDALMVFYEQVIKNEFNTKYNIYGYLYKVAIFRWINKIKKDRNIQIVEEPPEIGVEESIAKYDLEDVSKDKNILKTLFSELGEKCIELLTYTIYSDMLMEDLAIRFGFSSVEAVRMQHMRCKQKLIKQLEKSPALLKKLKGT